MPLTATAEHVTARPRPDERRCSDCDCVLRREHDGDRCECCERRRLAYNPAHDPAFPHRLLALLQERAGKPVRVHRELGIGHCGRLGYDCVHAQIRKLRRHGYVIEGSHGGTYTYLGGSGLAAGSE